MAFNLSSPVAKLAFEMALKNQQAIDSGGQFDAQARGFVSKALATGNDPLAPFDDIYRQYVDPAEAVRRAQAQAFNAYLIGLPELLTQSQKELAAQRKAGGSGDLDTTNLSNYESPADRFARIMGSLISPPTKKSGYLVDPRTATRTDLNTARKKITKSGMGSRTVTAKAL